MPCSSELHSITASAAQLLVEGQRRSVAPTVDWAAGFDNINIEPTRIYSVAQSKEILTEVGLDSEELAAQIDNKFMSAFVRARKPA
jgi:hypothetical protein